MENITFRFLNDRDWRLLEPRTLKQARGAVVLAQGTPARHIYVLRSGFVRVVVSDSGVAVARRGPGDVIGELSFLGDSVASANVIADTDVEVDVLDSERVRAALESEHGLSARFYRSLAVSVAERLKEASNNLPRLNIHDVSQVNVFHKPRVGHITEGHVPAHVVDAVSGFRHEMFDLERLLMRQKPSEAHRAQITAACNRMVEILDVQTAEDALVEAGYGDLLSFRDTADIEAGTGAYIFRQTFSFMMTSATMARFYMKPCGFSDDYVTGKMIYDDDPNGDGALGELVDRWFLALGLCRSRRKSRDMMASLLGKFTSGRPHADATNLASGCASALLKFLASAAIPVRANCIDLDQNALAHVAAQTAELPAERRPNMLCGNVLSLARGHGHIALQRQDIIYALGFFEYLQDDDAIGVLDWAFDHLATGGTMIFTNVDAPRRDRLLMEHILEWHVIHRDVAALERLVAHSRFSRVQDFSTDETGITNFAICTRQD